MEAQLYVGTYGKYNAGRLHGKWLDLTNYSDKEEFYEACKEVHKTEHDPEYMFQDKEGILYIKHGSMKAIYQMEYLSLWKPLKMIRTKERLF
jgi:antirestriction protein